MIQPVLSPYIEETTLDSMSVSRLAEHCIQEMSNHRRGNPSYERYALELFRRAMLQYDEYAWACLQQIFSNVLRGWMHYHPYREAAYRLDSEENYISLAFERFWQAAVHRQHLQFSSLASALQYLHASLNGAMLDTLRAYSRPREVPLPEPGDQSEPREEDQEESCELWEIIQRHLPRAREQRLAYLLFHCGLKPREVVRFCPREFSDVQEVYRLRRNIMERLVRNADQIRWKLALQPHLGS